MVTEQILIYVTALTDDPSDQTIAWVNDDPSEKIDDPVRKAAILEIIAMAVEPVHPEITKRLR